MSKKEKILRSYAEGFSIPTAIIDINGDILFCNNRLSAFMHENLNSGDNLILLLKKKARK